MKIFKLRRKSLLFIVIFLLLLTTFLIIIEFYLRHTTSYIISGTEKAILLTKLNAEPIIIDSPTGRRLIPNVQATILNHYISRKNIVIETNSLGFRDEEIDKEKKENDLRILALGDSITLGDYLQAEEVYVERLEEYLNNLQSRKHISVINTGVGDIGLKEEISILEEKGLELKPDIVMVEFYLNDSRPPWGFPKEIGYRGWLRRHSVLVDTVYKNIVLRKWIKEKGIDRFNWDIWENTNWSHDREAFLEFVKKAEYDWGAAWDFNSWKIIDEEFEKLRLISQKNGFKVVVVAFPVSYQVTSDFLEDAPQRILEEKTKEFGFNYIDLLPLFRENINRTDLYFDQAHPKEYANDIIGKYIGNILMNTILTEYMR